MSVNAPLAFTPIQILEIELSRPLPALDGYNRKTADRYRQAQALVRLWAQPIGIIQLNLEQPLAPDQLAEQIEQTLGTEITGRIQELGLAEAMQMPLTGEGLGYLRYELSDNEPKPLVSIVIPTRERPERLAACLQTIIASDYPNFEIIVVDNAPVTTATGDVVRNNFGHYHNIRYIQEAQAGASIARNRGLAEAKGDIVAFADDDVLVDSHWLSALAGAFNSTDNVGCVTGLILPLELDSESQLLFEQYGGFSKGFHRRIYDLDQYRPSDFLFPYTAGQFGSGASMAFRTDSFRKLGGFDPALGPPNVAVGGEDLAAYFTVITSHYRLVYEPGAIVYHVHPREYTQLKRQLYNYGVGLTAFLTKTIVDRPQRIIELASKLPYGLYFMFSPKTSKNRKKQRNYPRELTLLELKGMCYGPFAYLRSHRKVGKLTGLEKKA